MENARQNERRLERLKGRKREENTDWRRLVATNKYADFFLKNEQVMAGGLGMSPDFGLGDLNGAASGPSHHNHATRRSAPVQPASASVPLYPVSEQPLVPSYPPLTTSTPPFFQQGLDWQQRQQQQQNPWAASSQAVLTAPNINPLEYASPQPDPFMGDYVSPAALQGSPPLAFGFYGTSNPGNDLAPFGMTPEFGVAAQGSLAETSDVWWQQQPDDGSSGVGQSPSQNSVSVRANRMSPPATGSKSPTPPTSMSSGSHSHKSKLRSAPRTSKNVQHRPAESPEARKTRNSHNQVEKQYRNRLNAQFEGLLNALPDEVKSPTSTSASAGESDLDLGERRLSKGEVLDLSRRYIKTLERNCDSLEQERQTMLENMDRLRGLYVKGLSSPEEGSAGAGDPSSQ
ncbi:hypothetical protein B0H63DRAFT_279202 [Podospora didyma]|uniref:BHLH domain-containing protein n=1 Tax=Podospora didyma TaxID=330526 RepID=A0AAE0KGN5_9PEZI|nr:hypothetical protein B0H63DRAFT_279202 [Podospora didyma]